MKKMARSLALAAGILLFFVPGAGAQMQVQGVMVTDVTPRSFSVVWIADRPSDPSLKVYDAEKQEITEALVQTAFPTMHRNATLTGWARDAGMLKVRVEGLLPGTLYHFRTVTVSDQETVVHPEAEPAAVTTEILSQVTLGAGQLAAGGNDLVRFQVFRPDGITPARGSLVVVSVPQAAYPVSAYVGDGSVGSGAEPGLVLCDLNNLYDRTDHGSLTLGGGEVLTFRVLRGNGVQGAPLLHYRKAPPNSATVSVKAPVTGYFADFNCDDRVDIYDATLFAGSWGLARGDDAYNEDFNLNDDHVVDGDDTALFKEEYGKSAPFGESG